MIAQELAMKYPKLVRKMVLGSTLARQNATFEKVGKEWIRLAKACLTFDSYDSLPSIECPVLVLGSKGDRVVTMEGSVELAEALCCELYLYEDCFGHAVYDEAPDYMKRCLEFYA